MNSPASDISRMRVKNCIGMLRNWRLLFGGLGNENKQLQKPMSRRSVGWKVLRLTTMNSSEPVREDFGFFVAGSFPRLSPSLWASLPQTVNGNNLIDIDLENALYYNDLCKNIAQERGVSHIWSAV